MPDLAPSFAKLLVADPARSVTFYETLGFVVAERDPVFTVTDPDGYRLTFLRSAWAE